LSRLSLKLLPPAGTSIVCDDVHRNQLETQNIERPTAACGGRIGRV